MNYGKYIVPAGYIVSTAADLNKMNLMLLNDGLISNVPFISKETAKSIFTPFYVRFYMLRIISIIWNAIKFIEFLKRLFCIL